MRILREYSAFYTFFVLGSSDPYCEVSMGSQEHRTKVIPKDLNPKWNSTVNYFFINISSVLKTHTIVR